MTSGRTSVITPPVLYGTRNAGIRQILIELRKLSRRKCTSNLHPIDRTDGSIIIASQLSRRFDNAERVVYQDIGVKQNYFHSARNSF